MNISTQPILLDQEIPIEFYFYTIKEVEAAAERLYHRINEDITRANHRLTEISSEIRRNPKADTPAIRQEYQELRKKAELLQENLEWAKNIMERAIKLTPEEKNTTVEVNLRDMVRLDLKPRLKDPPAPRPEPSADTKPDAMAVKKKGSSK